MCAALAVMMGTLLFVNSQASAATPPEGPHINGTTRFNGQTVDTSFGSYIFTYGDWDHQNAYCTDPGWHLPDQSTMANLREVSSNPVLAYILWKFGNPPSGAVDAAAVDFIARNYYHPTEITPANTSFASNEIEVWDRVAEMMRLAQAAVAAPNPVVTVTVTIDSNKGGTFTVTSTQASGITAPTQASVTLTSPNIMFADGTSTATVTLGTPVPFTAKHDLIAGEQVSVSASVTVTGAPRSYYEFAGAATYQTMVTAYTTPNHGVPVTGTGNGSATWDKTQWTPQITTDLGASGKYKVVAPGTTSLDDQVTMSAVDGTQWPSTSYDTGQTNPADATGYVAAKATGQVYKSPTVVTARSDSPVGTAVAGAVGSVSVKPDRGSSTGTGTASVTLPADLGSGFYGVTFCYTKTDNDNEYFPFGQTQFCDQHYADNERFLIPMTLQLSTDVAAGTVGGTANKYLVKGATPLDQITVSLKSGDQWISTQDGQAVTLTLHGTLYGAPAPLDLTTLDTPPAGATSLKTVDKDITLPVSGGDAQVVSLTASDLGGYTVDKSQYYTWVWEVVKSQQSPAEQEVIAADVHDKFGQPSESGLVKMSLTLATDVAASAVGGAENKYLVKGATPLDAITVGVVTGDEWLPLETGEAASLTLRGSLYGGPAPFDLATSDAVPTGLTPLTVVTKTVTLPASGNAPLPVALTAADLNGYTVDHSQYYTWVWQILLEDQSAPVQRLITADVTDRFGQPGESGLVKMNLTISTAVNAEAVGGAGNKYLVKGGTPLDQITVGLIDGDQWLPTETNQAASLKLRGMLYGGPAPFDLTPSATVPEGLEPLTEITKTITLPTSGSAPVPVNLTAADLNGYTVDRSQYYTWVWHILLTDQSPAVQKLITANVDDRFGQPGESGLVKMTLGVTTKIVDQFEERGTKPADTVTVFLPGENDQWLPKEDGTAATVKVEGTYYAGSASSWVASQDPPASAEVLGHGFVNVTLPTSGREPQTVTVPEANMDFTPATSQYGTWVWKIARDSQDPAVAILFDNDPHDLFGVTDPQVNETHVTQMKFTVHTQVLPTEADKTKAASSIENPVSITEPKGSATVQVCDKVWVEFADENDLWLNYWGTGSPVQVVVDGSLYHSAVPTAPTAPGTTPKLKDYALTFTGNGEAKAQTVCYDVHYGDYGAYGFTWGIDTANQPTAAPDGVTTPYPNSADYVSPGTARNNLWLPNETTMVRRTPWINTEITPHSTTPDNATETIFFTDRVWMGDWPAGQGEYDGTVYNTMYGAVAHPQWAGVEPWVKDAPTVTATLWRIPDKLADNTPNPMVLANKTIDSRACAVDSTGAPTVAGSTIVDSRTIVAKNGVQDVSSETIQRDSDGDAYYTWVLSTSTDARTVALTTLCGASSETVHVESQAPDFITHFIAADQSSTLAAAQNAATDPQGSATVDGGSTVKDVLHAWYTADSDPFRWINFSQWKVTWTEYFVPRQEGEAAPKLVDIGSGVMAYDNADCTAARQVLTVGPMTLAQQPTSGNRTVSFTSPDMPVPTQAGTLFIQETIVDQSGNVVHRGACGVPNESLIVIGQQPPQFITQFVQQADKDTSTVANAKAQTAAVEAQPGDQLVDVLNQWVTDPAGPKTDASTWQVTWRAYYMKTADLLTVKRDANGVLYYDGAVCNDTTASAAGGWNDTAQLKNPGSGTPLGDQQHPLQYTSKSLTVPDEPGYLFIVETRTDTGKSPAVMMGRGVCGAVSETVHIPSGNLKVSKGVYDAKTGATLGSSGTSINGVMLSAGQTVLYQVTLDNSTGKAPAPVDVVDDISKVIDDATYRTGSLGYSQGLTVDPDPMTAATTALHITGTVPAGKILYVRYMFMVNPDGMRGDNQMINVVADAQVDVPVTPPQSSGTPIPPAAGGQHAAGALPVAAPTLAICDLSDPRMTCNPINDTRVVKDVLDPTGKSIDGSQVKAGDVLTYRLTLTNAKGTQTAPFHFVDYLGGVLDDAVYVPGSLTWDNGVTVSPTPITAATTRLDITGQLRVGDSLTMSFQVKVKPDGWRGDSTVANYAVKVAVDPSGVETVPPQPLSCLAADVTCTVNLAPGAPTPPLAPHRPSPSPTVVVTQSPTTAPAVPPTQPPSYPSLLVTTGSRVNTALLVAMVTLLLASGSLFIASSRRRGTMTR